MGVNQKVEDYMKTIYRLREEGVVRGAYIARELGVTKPTVSVSLKEMEEAGYLTIQPDRTVILTQKGEEIASRIVERNKIIFELLTYLGVNRETAYDDACNIEHGISDESLNALIKLRDYLTFIRKTPFGKTEESF
ncbi:MAG: metal-dependent transcriptional regulator [Ruminococcus sp.]|nr:metal-dependent transcriptional regulator [Ruminococcus sp.]